MTATNNTPRGALTRFLRTALEADPDLTPEAAVDAAQKAGLTNAEQSIKATLRKVREAGKLSESSLPELRMVVRVCAACGGPAAVRNVLDLQERLGARKLRGYVDLLAQAWGGK